MKVDDIWVTADIDTTATPEEIVKVLKAMPYLEAVVKEVLRYHTPVQFVDRLTARDVTLCGYHVPANTTVMIM